MSTSGAYDFRLAGTAVAGLVDDENTIGAGEWGWIERDTSGDGGRMWRSVYARCPDCGELMTLWRSFGDHRKDHEIDAAGNVSPSVHHTWLHGDPPVEQCGFHTQPPRLLGFVDRR